MGLSNIPTKDILGAIIALGIMVTILIAVPAARWFLLFSVPAGLLVAAILLINEFPDVDADAAAGKRTLVVRLGARRAVAAYGLLLVATYGSVAVGVLLGWLPPAAGVVVFVAPLSWRILAIIRANYADVKGLVPGMAATVLQQVLFLLLLAGACAADPGLRCWLR